jgi:hypothetical protein
MQNETVEVLRVLWEVLHESAFANALPELLSFDAGQQLKPDQALRCNAETGREF